MSWGMGKAKSMVFFGVMRLSPFSIYYVLSDSNPPADTWKIIFVSCFVEKHS
jgi:hypothetical protein